MAKVSFEKALARLEETVHRLEEGNLPLDDAVALFEEGTRLARACNEQLDAAELRVSQLVQSPDGEYREQDMHVAADSADAESGA